MLGPLFLFVENCRNILDRVVQYACCRLLYWHGREVPVMETLISFLFAVAAGVVSHLISKWLDGDE